MENYIIAVIIVMVAAAGIYFTVQHFQGKSGCCGGGGYRPRKKKLANLKYQTVFRVDGMHCEHCKVRVEEVVNDMKGLAGKVNLKKGELTVSYAEPTEDQVVKARIERAGYTVTEIRSL